MHKRVISALLLFLAVSCVEYPYEDERISPHSPYGPTSHKRALIEEKYRELLYSLEKGSDIEGDPQAGRIEQLIKILKNYEDDAEYSLQEIIVGIAPDEKAVGYLERVIYPRVIIFNRDTGKHEPTRFEFNYVRDLELSPVPRGVILSDGQTILTGRAGDQDLILGRFSLETASVLLLNICPCCGAKVPKDLFLSITRPDIFPDGVRDFKTAMANEHARLDRSYQPVKGLPAEFWEHPLGHKCYAAFADARDYGLESMIPVRFRTVKSSEFRSKEPGTGAPEEAPETEEKSAEEESTEEE